MPSPSPSPAPLHTRSPVRDPSPTASPTRPRSAHSASPRRSVTPRSPPRSRSPTRSPPPTSPVPRRNGRRSFTPDSRSRSRSRGRSYSRSPTPRDASPAPRSAKIVVEALTRNVKEDHVREIFGKYGVIKDLRMPMNPTFNINRGIAYILYEEIDDAERAIAKMHDAQLDGAKLQVSIVLPRRRFSRTPPPARRGPPPRERFHDDYDGYGGGRGGRGGAGGPPVDLRVGAGPAHRLVDQCREHRRDVQVVAEEEGEAMEDGTHHHAGVEGAVAVEEGDEALATVPMAVLVLATVAGAEIVDETPTAGVFEDGDRLQAPLPGYHSLLLVESLRCYSKQEGAMFHQQDQVDLQSV
ncbi:hypothetical protein J1614_006353 [Plenodomus biglobosus]|nr:hypothetical protein J1614_006353 [Plenodomus biglobosus]